tara:strand:+ start:177 stop:362 length:186 start_codon:yes stop_codon:yes gene_type:complete
MVSGGLLPLATRRRLSAEGSAKRIDRQGIDQLGKPPTENHTTPNTRRTAEKTTQNSECDAT